jgi:hypothetical protein
MPLSQCRQGFLAFLPSFLCNCGVKRGTLPAFIIKILFYPAPTAAFVCLNEFFTGFELNLAASEIRMGVDRSYPLLDFGSSICFRNL